MRRPVLLGLLLPLSVLACALACESSSDDGTSPGLGGLGGQAAGSGGEGSLGGSAGDSGTTKTCTLREAEPLTVATPGAVVENLHIIANGPEPAITVTATGVTLRNLWIEHSDGPGISFSGADDLVIENVHIQFQGAPASGANPNANALNIRGTSSDSVSISNARLERGSSGIWLLESPNSQLTHIEGHDFRGPYPRGQLVQWDKSDNGLLDDFSCENSADSWPEDNVNVYKSLNATIRNGFIDGNNSPTGVGVIFDGDTSTGIVENVDAIHMGNGCFSAYAGADGSTFRNTRCRDNLCEDQGRGVPTSNALMWSGKPGLTELRIESSTYFNACNPGNIVWPANSFAVAEVDEADVTPRAPVRLDFCWE